MMSPFGWIISLSLLTLMLKETFTFNTRLLFAATSMFAIIELFSIKNDTAVRSEQSSSSKTSDSTFYATYIDHVLSSSKLDDIKRWGLLSYVGSIKARESQNRPKKYENMKSSSSSSSSRGIFRIMRQSLCTLTVGFMTTLAISHDDKFIEKLCSMTRNLSFSHSNEILNNIAQGVLTFVSNVVTDACTVNSNVLSAVMMVTPLYLWVEFLNKSNHNRKAIRRIDDFLVTEASPKADRLLHDEFEGTSGWTNDGPNKGAGIQIENASIVGEDNNILIADTTINFEAGKINIIIGQVDPKKNRILSSIWGDNNLRLTKGKVLVHGRDLREWNRQALRSRMSYLRDREPEISLEAGVLSGLQPTATGKELNDQIRALDLSGARRVLNSLPQGPMTLIRNNEEPIPSSVTLTNDEWRCLGLSRALCNMDKDIILLDSPCNQMSEVEEKEFYCKLRKLLRQDQVIVTTSNRFSSAYNADNIVIFDKNHVSQGAANDPSILSTIKENLNTIVPFI
jgi:ABC-type multidrug transport system fused ATPase/permease subunit